MLHKNTVASFTQPKSTTIMPVEKDKSANFTRELHIFLYHHPEFLNSNSHLIFLRYCYTYYINCDPVYEDSSVQKKLKQAGEMAKEVMGFVIGAKI